MSVTFIIKLSTLVENNIVIKIYGLTITNNENEIKTT
jgi:hypothetical protein